MDVYTSEQEQVEQIKKWFREYGTTILVGAVLGLSAIYGWRYWKGLESQKAESASASYEAVLSALSDKDKAKQEAGVKAGELLISEFGDSIYADLTALHLAKAAVAAEQYDKAAAALRPVIDKPAQVYLGHIARLRLARILNAQNKSEEALSLLAAEKQPGAYLAAYEETRGDIFKAQGKNAEANGAYLAARTAAASLTVSGEQARPNTLLDMKIDDLTAAPAVAVTPEAGKADAAAATQAVKPAETAAQPASVQTPTAAETAALKKEGKN